MPCGKDWLIFTSGAWDKCLPIDLMNILFLSRWFPFPPDNGSKLRIYHLLNGLSNFHDVTLLSFVDPSETTAEQPWQNLICSEIQTVPWKPYDQRSFKARLGFLSPVPRSILDTYSPQFANLIRDTISTKRYDIVIASQLSMASYFPCFKGIPALFEEIELGIFHDQARRAGSPLKRLRPGLTWFKLRRYFSRILNTFRVCTVVSEREQRLFIDSFPKFREKIKVIPNCVNVSDYNDLEVRSKPNSLIFSGSFNYDANYEAMNWFVREVYPRILDQIPDADLIISGDHANKPLPSKKNITLTGYVDDIKSLIASCSVSIAPMWSGGGTRLKILEAMAIGVPVVATSKGAEGLGAQDGEHLLIANDPDAFAKSVIRILKDKNFRDHLSTNANRFVKKNYDWSAVMPRFMNLVEQVSAG